MAETTCSIDGCERAVLVKSRGWCETHYRRWRRHGDPEHTTRSPRGAGLAWLRANYNGGDECVIYPWNTDWYWTVKVDGVTLAAHVLACTWTNGPRPGDLVAAHNCGNPACVNGHHLRWATQADNLEDRRLHGTMIEGERAGSSRLTEAQVRAIRDDPREHRFIAADYALHVEHVGAIKRRVAWRHLD